MKKIKVSKKAKKLYVKLKEAKDQLKYLEEFLVRNQTIYNLLGVDDARLEYEFDQIGSYIQELFYDKGD